MPNTFGTDILIQAFKRAIQGPNWETNVVLGQGKNWLSRILTAERMFWLDLMAHKSWAVAA